jgi:hypothetical protein
MNYKSIKNYLLQNMFGRQKEIKIGNKNQKISKGDASQ